MKAQLSLCIEGETVVSDSLYEKLAEAMTLPPGFQQINLSGLMQSERCSPCKQMPWFTVTNASL